MNRHQIDAKNFLMKAYRVDERIDNKMEQIASLHDLATKATATISDMPGCGDRDTNRMEEAIVRIIDLESELKDDIVQLVELKKQILHSIKRVGNPEYQTLLELRYLSYMSWEQIAVELNYGIDNIFKLHRKALDEVEVPETVQFFTEKYSKSV